LQVFQPCESFRDSAEYLRRDPKRLGKQAVELYQIYKAVLAKIEGRKHGYENHPMVIHIYNNGRPYNIFEYIDELNRVWFELGYKRSEEFLNNILELKNRLSPYFTDEPYKKFFCWGKNCSYDDVCNKYKKLLDYKRNIKNQMF